MKNNYGELEKQIQALSDLIFDESKKYIIEVVQNRKINNTSALISLIISSHVTSMVNELKAIKGYTEELNEEIDNFIRNLMKIIPNIMPITNSQIVIKKDNIGVEKI